MTASRQAKVLAAALVRPETAIFAPHGLWIRNWEHMLDQIVATGINAIRLPFSNELLQPASLLTTYHRPRLNTTAERPLQGDAA